MSNVPSPILNDKPVVDPSVIVPEALLRFKVTFRLPDPASGSVTKRLITPEVSSRTISGAEGVTTGVSLIAVSKSTIPVAVLLVPPSPSVTVTEIVRMPNTGTSTFEVSATDS